jgi:hypothetical protein
MKVQETNEVRELTAEEMEMVTGGFLGHLDRWINNSKTYTAADFPDGIPLKIKHTR